MLCVTALIVAPYAASGKPSRIRLSMNTYSKMISPLLNRSTGMVSEHGPSRMLKYCQNKLSISSISANIVIEHIVMPVKL